MEKKIDKRENLKVVTSNSLVSAGDLSRLSLNARKLFYLAISQCKMGDTQFFEYEVTPVELAEMWDTDRSNVYREAENICLELMKTVLTVRTGEKSFEMYHPFYTCKYQDDSKLVFQIDSKMSGLLLGLKRDFSKPMLWDFMRMRSPYSMAIWHVMQREMKSFKPMMSAPIQFDLTLEELRLVTGCENKLKKLSEFRRFVLDKAIREIRKNCLVKIRYDNLKKGRTVVGFRFTAESIWGTMDESQLTLRRRQRLRKHDLMEKRKAGTITREEIEELLDLTMELEQMTLEDIENEDPV